MFILFVRRIKEDYLILVLGKGREILYLEE